jgi:LTXXQ motif family protein
MRNTLLIAAALLASTALTAPTLAQSPIAQDQVTAKDRNDRNARKDAREEGPNVNQLTAIDDARIAKLKADLRLTADQEGNWGSLERSLKDISKRRADRFVTRWNDERTVREAREREARDRDRTDQSNREARVTPTTAIDRMRRAAEAMNEKAADMKSLADAAEPLYGKLDDKQRRTLEGGLREQLAGHTVAVDEGRRTRRADRSTDTGEW